MSENKNENFELKPIDPYDFLSTGGRASMDKQKEKGGRPEECQVYKYYKKMFGENEDFKKKCIEGDILCGECKKQLGEKIPIYIENSELKEE